MKRTASLLTCLIILVGGIALATPAEATKTTTAENAPCSSCGLTVATGGDRTCLTVCLYVDLETGLEYWSANVYEGNCDAPPYTVYLWTAPGMVGPQACDGDPGCLSLDSPLLSVVPAIPRALPKNRSYVDILDKKMQFPGLPAGKTWNAKDALKDSGELKKTFVKVKNTEGKYFAVRLSEGYTSFDKVKFPAGTSLSRFKNVSRKISIGFEAEIDGVELAKLPEVIPTPSKRYKDCPTTFMLRVENCDYHVTTTVANGVSYSGDATLSSADAGVN